MADLLTVEEFFNYIKEPTPASTDSDYLLVSDLIKRASGFCKSFVGNPIINESFTEYIDGNGFDELLTSKFPIVSLTSVKVNGVDKTTDADFYQSGIVYLKSDKFPRGRKTVVLEYVAGHGADSSSIPQDIKQASLLIVHYWYKRDSQDYSETFGEANVVVEGVRFPSDALRLLKLFRAKRVY